MIETISGCRFSSPETRLSRWPPLAVRRLVLKRQPAPCAMLYLSPICLFAVYDIESNSAIGVLTVTVEAVEALRGLYNDAE